MNIDVFPVVIILIILYNVFSLCHNILMSTVDYKLEYKVSTHNAPNSV